MRRDKAYLQDILDAIKSIESFLEGKNKKEFFNSDLLQSAVVRKIEIIGEACKHLSKEIKKKYKSVTWKDISGMRNKVIHKYFGVDFERVWQTFENDIPKLKQQIIQILNEMENDNIKR